MTVDPNSTQQAPLNPDLAGYPDTGSLVKGYRESSSEAQRQKARADAAEEVLKNLAPILQGAANPRQSVPDRSQTPEGRLSDLGIPVDELRQVIRGEVVQAFEPISRGITARTTVLGRYPDYQKFEADVAAYIESDPQVNATYNRLFGADPVGAFEYAFLKFGENRRSAGTTPDNTREEAAHAAIPGARNGESRRLPQNGEDQIQQAWDRYQQNPSTQAAREYAKARLNQVIPEDFLRQ